LYYKILWEYPLDPPIDPFQKFIGYWMFHYHIRGYKDYVK
jgi:hypothetical protein